MQILCKTMQCPVIVISKNIAISKIIPIRISTYTEHLTKLLNDTTVK